MCGQLILGRHEAAPSAVEDIAYEVWAAEMDRGNFSLDAIQGGDRLSGRRPVPKSARAAHRRSSPSMNPAPLRSDAGSV